MVAVLKQGVFGAALATVVSQGISAILCFVKMQLGEEDLRIHLSELQLHFDKLKEIVLQGFPAGLQNSALSLGNVVVQSHVNMFGEYAMAGMGAHAKVEGFVFIPIVSISMAIATFVSQNIGAKQWERAKKGAFYAIALSLILSEVLGIFLYFNAPSFLKMFTDNSESIRYGTMFSKRLTLFYTALTFSHCATGILQGLEKSLIAMANMLSIWGIFRILYVTVALKIRPEFSMICWAYPITWCTTSVIFIIILFREIPKMNRKMSAG